MLLSRDPKALYVNEESILRGRKKPQTSVPNLVGGAHGRLVVAPTVLLAISIPATATALFHYSP